jgi:integrase/recombinase XerD
MAFCPEIDWSWLREIANRIKAKAKRKVKRHVTSDVLYTLGVQLMDRAEENARTAGRVRAHQVTAYRDGLMIALLALIPIRRRTLANIRIGKQLVKSGEFWALDIPAEDIKTRVPLEYDISPTVSGRIDTYLQKFRSCCPGAETDALWLSLRGRPLGGSEIYEAFKRRTSSAYGFAISPHHFRHAAATFWGERDPANVRGAKDLLGHASFRMTEKHYNMARSRIAGRKLAQAIDSARSSYRPQLHRRAKPPARAA